MLEMTVRERGRNDGNPQGEENKRPPSGAPFLMNRERLLFQEGDPPRDVH